MPSWDIFAAQLAVLRAQVDGLQAQVGGLQAQIDVLQAIVDEQVAVSDVATVCQHENREDDGSTLTEQRERCLNCGAVLINGKAA